MADGLRFCNSLGVLEVMECQAAECRTVPRMGQNRAGVSPFHLLTQLCPSQEQRVAIFFSNAKMIRMRAHVVYFLPVCSIHKDPFRNFKHSPFFEASADRDHLGATVGIK